MAWITVLPHQKYSVTSETIATWREVGLVKPQGTLPWCQFKYQHIISCHYAQGTHMHKHTAHESLPPIPAGHQVLAHHYLPPTHAGHQLSSTHCRNGTYPSLAYSGHQLTDTKYRRHTTHLPLMRGTTIITMTIIKRGVYADLRHQCPKYPVLYTPPNQAALMTTE